MSEPFSCLMVRPGTDDTVSAAVEQITADDLPAGDVLIRVEYSSLNYKDALACQAHPGVVRRLPHVPGIDCAGEVVESSSAEFQAGDAVLVTGYDLGTTHWGGYCEYVQVPAEWVVAMPSGMNAESAMTYGTAGFTAAQCVAALEHHGIKPDSGVVVVAGASGGVGSLSVAILAKLGHSVTAITGKPDQASGRSMAEVQAIGAPQSCPMTTAVSWPSERTRPTLSATRRTIRYCSMAVGLADRP